MKKRIRAIGALTKGIILWLRPHIFLGWLQRPLLLTSNTLSLSAWISHQPKSEFNDFFSLRRDYSKRYLLYKHIIDSTGISNQKVDYVEFGVSKGYSMKWWAGNCSNADWRFYGFDTFEGLPENWGTFQKGDMSAQIPQIDDGRVQFFKGLFQDTLQSFLKDGFLRTDTTKIIHLDADLFSATLYVLATIAPYIRKGDILIFDEFNVPNHEFFAFKVFSDSFYFKTKLLGAVNNHFQTALIVE